MAWVNERNLIINTVAELDNALLDYVKTATVSRAYFERLVSAVEIMVPASKRALPNAHGILRAWRRAVPPHHTNPMPFAAVLGIAYVLSNVGLNREAAHLLLGWLGGLRPTECANLRGCHLTAAQHGLHRMPAIIALGVSVGTKVRRQQSVSFDVCEDPIACSIVAAFVSTTAPNAPLSSITSSARMRTLIQWASTYLRFNTHFTAHSCRAGWASELKLRQVSFAVIKEKGRWATDDATRTYLDIVASMYNIQAVASATPAAEWLLGDFQNRFAWWG